MLLIQHFTILTKCKATSLWSKIAITILSHLIPRRKGIGKSAEARSEVRERASACSRMKQLSNRFDYSLLPSGETVVIYYPCSRLPMVFWNFPWGPLSPIRPTHGFAATSMCFTRRRQYAFSIRAVLFWNKLPADMVISTSVE